MRKKLLTFFMVAAAVLLCGGLLSACGDDSGDERTRTIIRYYLYDDTTPMTAVVFDGEFSFDMVPRRDHCVFLGLFDAKSGGTKIVDEYGRCNFLIENEMTLWAQWLGNNCSITFDPGEGTMQGERSMSLVYGSTLAQLPVAQREGYEFVGWSSNGRLVSKGSVPDSTTFDDSTYTFNSGTDTVELTASYEVKKFTLTLDYNDNSFKTQEITVSYGEGIDSVDFPEIEDTGSRELVGWSTDMRLNIPFTGTFDSDITLYAIWRDYKLVKFYEDPDSEEYTEQKVYRDEPFTVPETERPGYRLEGWYTSPTFSGNPVHSVTYGSSDTAYYARWELAQYHITFDTDGGDASLQPLTYTIEEEVDLPDPGKRQYSVFVGWCRKEDKSDTPVKSLPQGTYGDFTMYAKWKGENRTIRLDACGGYISYFTQNVEYGTMYTLGIPRYNGYEFQGWFTAAEDGVAMTDKEGNSLVPLEIEEEEITLYAYYLKEYYIDISYSHPGAGKVEIKDHYLAGEEVTLTVELLDDGYEIDGFYSGSESVSKGNKYHFYMPEQNLDLKIEFFPRTFSVSLDSDGGYLSTNRVSIEYMDTFTLPVPFKQGFVFEGWMYDNQPITDKDGKGLSEWTIKSNVRLIAQYAEDPDAENKILVYNKTKFMEIMDDPSKTYVIVSDIDMSGSIWKPVAFSGTILGNGFTVRNISLYSSNGNLGVFTSVSGAIGDLNFENLQVSSYAYENVYVGGVCGELRGSLSNIHVISGSVTGKTSHIGGIVGKLAGGSISGCINEADVKGDANDTEGGTAGGICGWVESGSISRCENRGTVENNRYTGGIVGQMNSNVFSDLENYGAVVGKDNVGGVFGYLSYGGDMNFGELSNEGTVTGKQNVGGVIGQLNDVTASYFHTLVFKRLTNNATITGTDNVGGIMGYVRAEDNKSYYSYTMEITANSLKNQGDVKGTSNVGGIFGYVYTDAQSSVLQDSSSSAKVEAEYSVGGLIGYSINLQIVNCSNNDSTITATGKLTEGGLYYAYVGGYVGRGYAVNGCENKAEIAYSESGSYVGGIAGYANGNFESCKNYADISAQKANGVGGIVGYQDARGNVTMRSLENSGQITGNNDVGGIVGRMYDRTQDINHSIVIARFTNSGNVTGNENVGGSFGYFYADDVKSYESYTITLNAASLINTGNITGTASVGGLFGYGYTDSGSSKISESKSSSTVTAQYRVGGIAGYLVNIQIESTSNQDSKIVATGALVVDSTYYAYVGGYVGQGFTIRDAVNASDIVYTGRGIYVGGIAGYTNGDLESDSNSAKVTAETTNYVGGIAGYEDKRGNLSLRNLSNTGEIVGGDYTGGLIGCVNDRTQDLPHTATINELSNSGTVTGKQYTGGLFGYLYADDTKSYESYTITITAIQLTNSGSVKGTTCVGGLIGYGYSDSNNSKIIDGSNSAKIEADSRIGGLAGYLQNIQIENGKNAGTEIVATGYAVEGDSFYAYVGGYVGQGYTVKGCKNDSTITYNERGSFVGGVAGYTNGDLVDCENTADVNAPQAVGVGGIVGYSNAATYTMSNLKNSGNVVGNECVGGIVGRVYAHTQDANHLISVRLLTNSASVSGTKYIGGIFGYLYVDDVKSYESYKITMTATEVTNSGAISGDDYVGGFFGSFYSDGSSTVTGYVTEGQATGSGEHVGDLVGENTNLTMNV